jgi:hypothetical protein
VSIVKQESTGDIEIQNAFFLVLSFLCSLRSDLCPIIGIPGHEKGRPSRGGPVQALVLL